MARSITVQTAQVRGDATLEAAWRGIDAATAVLDALATIGSPVRRAFGALVRKTAAVLEAQALARRQRREDERLWAVAMQDARVMADLSRAMSADASRDAR